MYFSFHFRLDASLQQMLREMKALFGDDLWSNVIIGVSFWSFSDTVVQVKHSLKIVGRVMRFLQNFCREGIWYRVLEIFWGEGTPFLVLLYLS